MASPSTWKSVAVFDARSGAPPPHGALGSRLSCMLPPSSEGGKLRMKWACVARNSSAAAASERSGAMVEAADAWGVTVMAWRCLVRWLSRQSLV
jgi:hypothetical protein